MTQKDFMNSDGLLYLVQRLKTVFDTKVDKKEGFSLMSDAEIARLASVTNYDDTEVKTSITNLNNKIIELEENAYDDTEVRNLIKGCQEDISALKAKVINWDAAFTHSQSAHAPSNAQANVIESVKVNGTAIVPSAKSVNINVPTKLSDLQNDSNYISSIPSEYITESELANKGFAVASNVYSKTEIDTKLKGGVHAKGSVNTYAELPTSPSEGDMYNIVTADPTHDVKAGDNLVWVNGKWDNFGGIFDTSGLVSKADAITNEEIEQIFTTVMG